MVSNIACDFLPTAKQNAIFPQTAQYIRVAAHAQNNKFIIIYQMEGYKAWNNQCAWPSMKMSSQSVNFLSNIVNKQINRQTNQRQ